MEQIKKFLRSRGFALALLACLVAAAAAGVWAVRTVRDELKKSYDDLTTPQEEPAPEPQLTLDPQEDDVWQQPVTDAAESGCCCTPAHRRCRRSRLCPRRAAWRQAQLNCWQARMRANIGQGGQRQL